MRTTLIIISILLCCSCSSRNEKFRYRSFPLNEATLLKSIDSLYKRNPQYLPPAKWKIYDSYSQRGAEFSRERKFYFAVPDEEMYSVAILPSGDDTKIIITAIVTNKGWQSEDDLSPNEVRRIEKRFDDRIIAKLELITNSNCSK